MATKKISKGGTEQNEATIINNFQQMRREQRRIVAKIAELESDKSEHRLVIKTLKEADPDRRCFRMVGGVLIERTVKEILPALEDNLEQLSKVLESLKTQLEEKGKEVNAYREKHNIRFRGETDTVDKKNSGTTKDSTEQNQGILIS